MRHRNHVETLHSLQIREKSFTAACSFLRSTTDFFDEIRKASLTSIIGKELQCRCGSAVSSVLFVTSGEVPSRCAEAAIRCHKRYSSAIESKRSKNSVPSYILSTQQRTAFSPFARCFTYHPAAKSRDEDIETSDLGQAVYDAHLQEPSVDDSTARKYESLTEYGEIPNEEDEEPRNELEDEAQSPLDKATKEVGKQRENSGLAFWIRLKKWGANKNSSLETVIEEWKKEGNVLSREHIVCAITHFRRRRKYSVALQVSNWVMNEKPFELNDLDYGFRLELIGKVHGLEKAEEYFTKIPKEFQSQMAYHILLMTYVERSDEVKVEGLIRRIEKLGIGMTTFMYNQLLLFYRRKGRTHRVVEVVLKMEETNVQPDTYTYYNILDIKARRGDVKGMEMIMSVMEDSGVKPDASIYALFAKSCLEAGLTEKAKEALDKVEIIASNITKKHTPYHLMLELYADLGNLDDIERVWKKLLNCPVTYLDDYVKMIHVLGRVGKVKRAEEIFEMMWHSTGMGRVRQLNALLSVYCKQGMIVEAEKLMKQMKESSLNPDGATFYYLIHMYAKLGLEQKVIEVLEMLENSMMFKKRDFQFGQGKVWYATIHSALEMFAKKGDVANAEKVFKDFKVAGHKASFVSYLTLLNTYVKAGRVPHGFLDRMYADGNTPNTKMRAILKQLKGT